MRCEAGDLLCCPFPVATVEAITVGTGCRLAYFAFKYITTASQFQITDYGYVKLRFTDEQLPVGSPHLKRIWGHTFDCPSDGSPSTTVRTDRGTSPSSAEWKYIKAVIDDALSEDRLVRRLVRPREHLMDGTSFLVPGTMCAVNTRVRRGLFMGLTPGDYIAVINAPRAVQNTGFHQEYGVLCCKYWLGADSGAITDFGFCRLSDLEHQRCSDHLEALYYALTTGSHTGCWDGPFQMHTPR